MAGRQGARESIAVAKRLGKARATEDEAKEHGGIAARLAPLYMDQEYTSPPGGQGQKRWFVVDVSSQRKLGCQAKRPSWAAQPARRSLDGRQIRHARSLRLPLPASVT